MGICRAVGERKRAEFIAHVSGRHIHSERAYLSRRSPQGEDGSPSFGNKKHGTRETGDRRRSSLICNRFPSSGLRPSVSAEAPPRQDAVTGCHPFHGFQLPFLFLRGVRVYESRCARLLRPRRPPLRCSTASLWVCRPLHGLECRSTAARQIPV